MEIKILQLLGGAEKAEGLTVIIDVFRAFTTECYMMDRGVKAIIPVGDLKLAYALKDRTPGLILVGERKGKKCEGFDYGNSPAQVLRAELLGKTAVHTTSAGTQGIANAHNASEILTGSLVNARATAEYIKRKNPGVVSLVCMGYEAKTEAREDTLCAEYIRSLLLDMPMDPAGFADALRGAGARFFDPANRDVYPEEDFWLCVQADKFPFALRVDRRESGNVIVREDV
ncbi:MAG: 2-phosphosulfolactate phosphatase [Oscillospiraceae bacterium]